jgi:two-component system, response regulator / RNA-binding antiterminator
MRVAIVDESSVRAAIIEEGLREAGLDEITVLTERKGLVARLESLAPDVVLLNLGNPSRDSLEESFMVSRALSRPIAMFVDSSDEEATGAAVEAGVSAYVVDGMRKERIKSILDLAIKRFNAFSRLQNELAEAKTALAERKTIEKAKTILIQSRGLSEPDAYALLRSTAMNQGRRIVEVADALITANALLKGTDQ